MVSLKIPVEIRSSDSGFVGRPVVDVWRPVGTELPM